MIKKTFFADTKQQVDQIKKCGKFHKAIVYFKKKTFFKVKTTITFPVKKQNTLMWNCLGSQLNISTVGFALKCSVFWLTKKTLIF